MKDELEVTQAVTMSRTARHQLRTKAVEHDLSGGPFARVLIAVALEWMESNADFGEQVASAVTEEKKRYKKNGGVA